MTVFRWIFLFFFVWGKFAFAGLNSIFTLSVVAMVNQDVWEEETVRSDECLSTSTAFNSTIQSSPSLGELYWDPRTQGVILGANSYGNLFTHFLGGFLAVRFGAKWVYGSGILFMSLFSFVTPVAARAGVPHIFFVRFLYGMAEGLVIPATATLISRWAPKSERGTFGASAAASVYLGLGLLSILTGFFASRQDLGGWPTTFYVTGLFGVIWFVFWAIFVTSTPEENSRMSKEELSYIKLGQNTSDRYVTVPWKSILTSWPVWICFLANFAFLWHFVTFSMSMPLYLETVLRVPIESNGIIVGLNYSSNLLGAFLGGFASDFIVKRFDVRLTSVRKVVTTLASVFSCLWYLSIPVFGGCRISSVFAFMFLTQLFLGINVGGSNIVNIDIAPQFAGVLSGLQSTITATCGFLSPLLTGFIISDNVTRERWLYVVICSSGISLFGLVCFLIFGTAQVQPWAVQSEDEQNSETKPLIGKKPVIIVETSE